MIHDRAPLVVAHEAVGVCRPVSRVPVRLLEGVAVAIGIVVARQRDGYAAARAREAKVGQDAGSSLAAGHFNAAGHATKGERKGPRLAQGYGAHMHAKFSSA